MPVRTSPPTLADTTWAYLAGLVDGEGTITIVRRRGSRNKTLIEYAGTVQVAQKDRAVLDWLKETVGFGSVIVQRKASYQRNELHFWGAQNYAAYLFVKGIRPWLRIKARQADIILEFNEIREAWAPNRRQLGFKGTVPTPPEVLAQYQDCLERIQGLNRRGWTGKPGGHWTAEGVSVANGLRSGPNIQT